MSINPYSRDNIQYFLIFIFVCGWILADVEGINTTVLEYFGLSWDQGKAECHMRNSRLPNISFDLIPQHLSEKYNTTPVWVDVTYVNKTESVILFSVYSVMSTIGGYHAPSDNSFQEREGSGQERMQTSYKCMAVSKVDGSFLYRLDNCANWNRVICGNPALAEQYPGKQFSWVAAQKTCQIAKSKISNMEKSESEKKMTEGVWYWMFDVRKLTFSSDFAEEKDQCGYLKDGHIQFRDCTDSVPVTLCIADPKNQMPYGGRSSSDDSNDLKIVLIAVFVSLALVSATVVAVICFIKRRHHANESKSKTVTTPNTKLDINIMNAQSNTAIQIGRTDSLVSRSPSSNSTAGPAQKENKTVRATT